MQINGKIHMEPRNFEHFEILVEENRFSLNV